MNQLLKKYGPIVVGVLAIITVVVFWRSYHQPSNVPRGDPNLAFYVDEETKDEFVKSAAEIPPLIGKGGKPTVVRAVKYSCDGGKTVKIHHFQKYTDEAQQALKTIPMSDPRRAEYSEQGELVRLPAPGSPWKPASTPEGDQIRSQSDCPEGKYLSIFP